MGLMYVTGVGTFGADPVMRYLDDEKATPVCNANLACNEVWKDANGETQKKVTWIRCTWWGKQAEVINQYCRKGMSIQIEKATFVSTDKGYPRLFQRDDGTYGASYEVKVRDWDFIPGQGNGNGGGESTPAGGADNDEIPF